MSVRVDQLGKFLLISGTLSDAVESSPVAGCSGLGVPTFIAPQPPVLDISGKEAEMRSSVAPCLREQAITPQVCMKMSYCLTTKAYSCRRVSDPSS